MTRFARAHGSKASNERQPEEATSWNVLKQQLLEQQAASKHKVEEATNPAKQTFVFQTDKTKTTEWAEFEETPTLKYKNVAKEGKKLQLSEEKLVGKPELAYGEHHSSKTKLHKIKNCSNANTGTEKKLIKLKKIEGKKGKTLLVDAIEDLTTVVIKDKAEVKISKREKRNNKLNVLKKSIETFSSNSKEVNSELKPTESIDGSERQLSKRQLKRKRQLLKKQQDDGFVLKRPKPEEVNQPKPIQDKTSIHSNGMKDKSNLSKQQKNSSSISTPSNEETMTTDGKIKSDSEFQAQNLKKQYDPTEAQPRMRKKHYLQMIHGNGMNTDKSNLSKQQKNEQGSELNKQESSTSISTPINEETVTTDGKIKSDTEFQAQSKRQKRNLKKQNDSSEVQPRKRRKHYLQTTTMVINGQEIEVTMFDGFPVRKQDADRLKELRKQMVDNGIPPIEIENTMKLERRKAEKALARERRKVCFHCRKGGHNLSECPELNEGSNQDAAGSGICYKCGSTEHTHFECRVVRGQEFRFAKCFICQEQGHISRQCPDNPRGLYPKGGGCKVCGDVTHLKKDCPDLHEKKEQNVITLDTARSDRIEALDEDLRMKDSRPVVDAPKNKIVKF